MNVTFKKTVKYKTSFCFVALKRATKPEPVPLAALPPPLSAEGTEEDVVEASCDCDGDCDCDSCCLLARISATLPLNSGFDL